MKLKGYLLCFKVFIQQTRLNALIILVFTAFVIFVITFNSMIENLADFNAWINPDRMYAEYFQCPETTEAYITKAGCNMDKQS